MRVLFDVNHPAHVHLFRNAISALQEDGADVVVTSRDKDVTIELLDAYSIDHRMLSRNGDGTAALVAEWSLRELRVLSVVRETDPDVIVSRVNPPALHAGAVTGTPRVAVADTKIRSPYIRLVYGAVTNPFVDTICTPPGFDVPAKATHHLLDFQELAYLHPDRFDPDPELLRDHGVDPDERYFVVRFSGVDAFHDVGHSGFSAAASDDLISTLERHGTVYISSANALPDRYEQYRLQLPVHLMHQLLSHADLFVGDSGTMSTEAALLGTPAVRMNTMVGIDEENVFRELERRYGLLHSFADEQAALTAVEELLENSDDSEWERRRQKVVADKTDVTGRMVDIIREAADGA